jgi:hypothetical protein
MGVKRDYPWLAEVPKDGGVIPPHHCLECSDLILDFNEESISAKLTTFHKISRTWTTEQLKNVPLWLKPPLVSQSDVVGQKPPGLRSQIKDHIKSVVGLKGKQEQAWNLQDPTAADISKLSQRNRLDLKAISFIKLSQGEIQKRADRGCVVFNLLNRQWPDEETEHKDPIIVAQDGVEDSLSLGLLTFHANYGMPQMEVRPLYTGVKLTAKGKLHTRIFSNGG